MNPISKQWYRNSVLYQIYPRSFYDTNKDGVGDLEGIRQKLDHIVELGVGAIWLSPFYPSPMADFGYDISDYKNVNPLFGTLDDFKALLQDVHKKGLKLLIDLVPNHTSDEHVWFQESKSSKDNPRRNWYTWRDPGLDGGPPNNWLSVFGGSAWEYDELSGQYYLHSFLKKQPDVNWDNPGVRAAMSGVAKFWLELGVDGFRVDVPYWISKDPHFRDDPKNPDYEAGKDNPYNSLLHKYSHNGPNLFRYFNEFLSTVKAYAEKFVILEVFPEGGNITEDYMLLYEHLDATMCAPFNFEGLNLPWDAKEFEDFIGSFESFMEPLYIPIFCMSNHDQPRIVNRIGPKAARTMAMMQLTLPGLPVIYYGDEIGMSGHDIPFDKVQDPFEKQVPGKGLGRDPERTPMQWNGEQNAGFSNTEPWLPINQDYESINVGSEKNDPSSMLTLYKSLIKLRASSNALSHGSYKAHTLHRRIFCYVRSFEKENLAVVLNFSDNSVNISNDFIFGNILISTDQARSEKDIKGEISLSANEGVILRLS